MIFVSGGQLADGEARFKSGFFAGGLLRPQFVFLWLLPADLAAGPGPWPSLHPAATRCASAAAASAGVDVAVSRVPPASTGLKVKLQILHWET